MCSAQESSTNTTTISGRPAGEAVHAERRDAAGLQKILDQSPTLYINIVGEPTILLPLGVDRLLQQPHRLHSRRVRVELYKLITDKAKFLPFEQEVNRILAYLEGLAWGKVCIDAEYRAAVDDHPVIEAIHIWFYSYLAGSVYENKASELLKELETVAKSNGIDIHHKAWPKGPNKLSQELWDLRTTLNLGGIEFERGRSNGFRWVKLWRTRPRDDDGDLSSLDRPDANTPPANELPTDGDRDGSIASVFHRIQPPSNGA